MKKVFVIGFLELKVVKMFDLISAVWASKYGFDIIIVDVVIPLYPFSINQKHKERSTIHA